MKANTLRDCAWASVGCHFSSIFPLAPSLFALATLPGDVWTRKISGLDIDFNGGFGGLVGKPELNDQLGVVVELGLEPGDERCTVILQDEERKRIKWSNLEQVCSGCHAGAVKLSACSRCRAAFFCGKAQKNALQPRGRCTRRCAARSRGSRGCSTPARQ